MIEVRKVCSKQFPIEVEISRGTPLRFTEKAAWELCNKLRDKLTDMNAE